MKRFGQMIRLKSEGAKEYVHHHASVWPAVLETIEACNIRNYSIYLKDHYLFAYFEYTGSDFETDMAKMASKPETQRWWKVVKPLMKPLESRSEENFELIWKKFFIGLNFKLNQ